MVFISLIILVCVLTRYSYKKIDKKVLFNIISSILPFFLIGQYFFYVRNQIFSSNKEQFIPYYGIFKKIVYFLKHDEVLAIKMWWNLYLYDFFYFLEFSLLILILTLSFELTRLIISLTVILMDFIANKLYEYFFNLYIKIYILLKKYWLSILFLINIVFISWGIYVITFYLINLVYLIIKFVLCNLADITAYILSTIILEVLFNSTTICFLILFLFLFYFDVGLKNEVKKF